MKDTNKVIKRSLAAVVVMVIGSTSFAALIDEEFDGPTFSFTFENYGGGAVNTYSQDTSGVLSGANSLKMDIVNSGDPGNWWALQVRQGLTLVAGDEIEVSFQVKSTADISFLSRLEGGNIIAGSHNYQVDVLAGETKTVTYQMASDTILSSGGSTFMFALGDSTAGAAGVWIDNVSMTVIPEPATFGLLGLAAAVLIGMRRFRN